MKTTKLMNARAKPGHAYVPTSYEHVANIISHAVMIPPCFVAVSQLYGKSYDGTQKAVSVIYGVATLLLFAVSSTFHTIAFIGRFRLLKDIFHIGDRAIIYLFIAASYTPWLILRDYHDNWGRFTLVIVWSGAVFGIAYQYTFHEKYKWLETLLYLIIGIVPASTVLHMRERSGIVELAAGGLIYASGVVFFKCDGRIPFAHAIWHCFVLIGAATHFLAIDKYLIGPSQAEAAARL